MNTPLSLPSRWAVAHRPICALTVILCLLFGHAVRGDEQDPAKPARLKSRAAATAPATVRKTAKPVGHAEKAADKELARAAKTARIISTKAAQKSESPAQPSARAKASAVTQTTAKARTSTKTSANTKSSARTKTTDSGKKSASAKTRAKAKADTVSSHEDEPVIAKTAPAPAVALAAQPVARTAAASQSLKRGASSLDKAAPFRRCLWVTRWDFHSPEDIKRICYNAASARFTDVLFQVRGEGTVFYRSAIEPWAFELTSDSPASVGHDPGWDPLAVAIQEAHRYGLRLHAYLNALPGWAQASMPPEASGQLFVSHRSWFMVDAAGRTMQPAGFYSFLDPGLPQVRDHLAQVFGEVAKKYAVDGIHLDYIRYPEEKGDYSYQPAVLQAFRALCGGTPQSAPEQWAGFRRQQVTLTVETIANAVRKVRPSVEMSAAIIADVNRQVNDAYQSGADWVRSGALDAIAPMAYCGDMAKFDQLCQPYRDPKLRQKVWCGIWADPKRNLRLEPMIRRAAEMGFGAVAVFSYSELFPSHQPTTRAKGVYQAFVSKQSDLSQAETKRNEAIE